MGKAVRTFNITNLQTRDGENDAHIISGYAAVFNSETTISDYFREKIAPGAFTRTLQENDDIRCLFNHNWENILGRTKSGTLKLNEDDHGLAFEVTLPNTTVARDLVQSMTRGDVNQCSFQFIPTAETWEDENSDMPLRTIDECTLYEVSIVTIPAYDDTEASLVRSGDTDHQESISRFKKRQKLLQTIERGLKNE